MKTTNLFRQGSVILAPMAGYTDATFRLLCQQGGADFCVTEMVSSMALVMNNAVTQSLLYRHQGENPCAVQIFGHDPSVMAQSVQLDCMQDFAAVDINMGCPVKKIVGNGEGSALLENPTLAGQIISSVKKATNKPVCVKFRLGVNDDSNVVNFAKMCCDSGADLLTVHFRTRKQMYSGQADFATLPAIVKASSVPVVANGDVATNQQYQRLIDMGAYAVAVGRNALGNPQIFSQIKGEQTYVDLLTLITNHIQLMLAHKPERVVCNEFKKHAAFYLKGIRGAKQTIVAVHTAHSVDEQLQLITNFLQNQGETL